MLKQINIRIMLIPKAIDVPFPLTLFCLIANDVPIIEKTKKKPESLAKK